MHIGSGPHLLGRHVVDIDGCLRATDQHYLTPRDIVALHGGIPEDAPIVWEVRGEAMLLGPADRVELNEDCVAFFRSLRGARLFRIPLTQQAEGPDGQREPSALAA